MYSTGTGNGAFGLGWNLRIPGVSRKTSKGVPHYNEERDGADLAHRTGRSDVFILTGSEDLVPVGGTYPGRLSYRPRTEGLFAQIDHVRDADDSHWEVRGKDGLKSSYGTAGAFGTDPATIADPGNPKHIFEWKLTSTEDPFGNRIEYEYERDRGQDGPHNWDQLYLSRIRYVDAWDDQAQRQFHVTVEFNYELRTGDPHSQYRPGFEIRTRKRCTSIAISAFGQRLRTYDLVYLDQLPAVPETPLPANGVSLLSQVRVTGHNGNRTEELPPLEFHYTPFQREQRAFFPLRGTEFPTESLASPALAMVDLFGSGLPDVVELNGTIRYWRNLGDGHFDMPRYMKDAPSNLALTDPGVEFIDADGNGRTDLLVTRNAFCGYFPLRFGGEWDRKSFRRYRQAPSFSLQDPQVKLIDLDGDGVTDAVRSGTRLECYFNDPVDGWATTRWVERRALDAFPNFNFSDPGVHWGDFTGDGLQTMALITDGTMAYWPHYGHGNWGRPVPMRNSPHFPRGYDPRRILVGDVDGDGLADIVYVDDSKVTLWINQSGNRWSHPIEILGTPAVSDLDAVQLLDVLGTGISGVLWSRDANEQSRDHWFFLDFTGGVKPNLLHSMDNHIGAVTKVGYAPSVKFYLKDQKLPATRWKTALPFPVQVVSCVEVIDYFSGGKLTTEYNYHDGYWDGAEREFRGFGMVERCDTETFETYDGAGLHGTRVSFVQVDRSRFSPPTLTRTWFHQGPVEDVFGGWQEPDFSRQYWAGDPQLLRHTESVNQFLRTWPASPAGRRVKRDAVRALRGSVLRTELYARDGSSYEDRPYTVSEFGYGLVEFAAPAEEDGDRPRIFFPHATSHRTTQWERGNDPMTQFSFTRYTDENSPPTFDPFGRPLAQTQIACPRGWRTLEDQPGEPYLATRECTVYARPVSAATYIHNRTARTTSYELQNTLGKRIPELAAIGDTSPDLSLIGQTLSYYDGDAFVGLPLNDVGPYGSVSRTENLVLTDRILEDAYEAQIPPYLEPSGNHVWTADYPAEFRSLLPRRAGYAYHTGNAEPADVTGYFATTDRRRYDFQTPGQTVHGLVLETLDPLHDATRNPAAHRTLVEYDQYRFLPTEVTDAVGLVSKAVYDYRAQQPQEVTDPNGNTTRFSFSPLGLLESSYVQGKNLSEGDHQRPGVRREFGFSAFQDSAPEDRQPIFVRTIRRLHHDTEPDLSPSERDKTIESIEYSDGFGRLLQTRSQGEDMRFGDEHFGGGESLLPAIPGDSGAADIVGRLKPEASTPNVLVSGWQIHDNKGRVVSKYEPFFSEGWGYGHPLDADAGQKISTFYDPRGHAIRTLQPDGSEERVLYGVPGTISAPELEDPDAFEPTPWEAYTYDANDNAGRTHPAQTAAYRHHWNTPASILIDALGRVIEAVVCNRNAPDGDNEQLPPMQKLRTRTTYDIRGNSLTVRDSVSNEAAPLGRLAFRHVFDLANRTLRIESLDAGLRITVPDASGSVIEQRDGKGALVLHGRDDLNRPFRLWARDNAAGDLTLREKLEYGDGGSPGQPAPDRAANAADNRLGRLSRYFDEAGKLSFGAYDFKGNLREKTRYVVSDAAILGNFQGPPPGWQIETFRVDWDDAAAVPLDAQPYVSTASFDALNRVTLMTYPQDVEGTRRHLRPHYNRAGALENMELDGETFVEHIAYNAKGQRVFIAYGNGIMTRQAYDHRSFRLVRLRTEAYNKPAESIYRSIGSARQELAYETDLAGNMRKIIDRTSGCGVQDTPEGQDRLDRLFAYDALYRLISATGRECNITPYVPPAPLWDVLPHCTDATRTRRYAERYDYDPAGNMYQQRHTYFRADGSAQGSNRQLTFASNTNRLESVVSGTHTLDYGYDRNGNLTNEGTSRLFEWDFADRMVAYRTQIGGSEPSVDAQYLYDADGQRVKKLVRKQGGRVEITVYIDGVFEHHRIVHFGALQENNTVHVMDTQSRIALVRVGIPFAGDTTPAVKYHLGDHLGNNNLVLDNSGGFINCEEYTPYGETSFGSFARKRYRFSGKERDDESGLSYHGARYYAMWLGRWISCDPLGPVSDLNLYAYTNNPLSYADPSGTVPECKTTISTEFTLPTESTPSYQIDSVMTTCKAQETSVQSSNSNLLNSPITPDIPLKPQAELVQEVQETVIIGETPFQPDVSDPTALERAKGTGHIEGGDIAQFGKGLYDGPAGWLGLPLFQPDPRYAGAHEMGSQIGKNLALEGVGAILFKVVGRVFEAARAAKPWSGVRAEIGSELSLPAGTEVHHWLIPQGGKGTLSWKGFFAEQWGRFVPEAIRNARWNLMVPPVGELGPWSRAWHAGLHGKGPYALGLMGRLWHGSPIWAKAAAASVPPTAGAAAYAADK